MTFETPDLIADDGEGIVHFPKSFLKLEWIDRADLLKDWIFELETEYARSLRDIDDFIAAHRKDADND